MPLNARWIWSWNATPDDGCRNRRDEQQAGEPPAGPDGFPALGGSPTGSRERAQEAEDFTAQEDQGSGERSQMNHDLEEDPRTSERFIRQQLPAEKPDVPSWTPAGIR